MWLKTSCKLAFDIQYPTPFILMLRPRIGAQQWVEKEEYIITPNVSVTEFTDEYGNLCQRLMAPAGRFTINTSTEVHTEEFFDEQPGASFVEIQNLPSNILKYLLPSRYCESDRFNSMTFDIVKNAAPGFDQVSAIEKWLLENIIYLPESSVYPLSASEINVQGTGVCRDLAHLGIALCRSISIPARMAVGYMYNLEPMDLHAWFEAYVGGRWYTFDATQKGKKGGYVTVGYGRDAADLAIFNQFGPAVYPTAKEISVIRLD